MKSPIKVQTFSGPSTDTKTQDLKVKTLSFDNLDLQSDEK